MEVDRNGLEVLDRAECLRLLALTTIGRIGFTSGALPTVLPMNFHLSGERILVRTGRGSKLDAALQNAVVAFETDDFDPIYHSGWSVAVTGVASVVTDQGELEEAYRMPIARWAPVGEEAVLAISTEFVSGRRISDQSSGTRHSNTVPLT
jgi:nitroimidazol reductase NimA-like FMN-containing flavoprotein (pyridoxamine 5'-phosphate oxidase superfamily)